MCTHHSLALFATIAMAQATEAQYACRLRTVNTFECVYLKGKMSRSCLFSFGLSFLTQHLFTICSTFKKFVEYYSNESVLTIGVTMPRILLFFHDRLLPYMRPWCSSREISISLGTTNDGFMAGYLHFAAALVSVYWHLHRDRLRTSQSLPK